VPSVPFTVLDETRAALVHATVEGDTVRLTPTMLEAALRWTVKPEGLCRGAVCVPTRSHPDLVTAAGVDLAGVAALLERPLALDVAAAAAALGTAARERAARLASLEAPDFTLADLDGRRHSLSDWRGKKVLLLAYASW
jgi:hypothetical protein